MDILKVLNIISREFEKHELHYAVIGGVALNALGLARSTVDLDFLVLAEDTPKLQKILEQLSYNCVYKSQNVSQYTSSSSEMGEIDVLHAFRSASLKMLKRAKKVYLFNNSINIYVLCPEDIVGLKLQAMMNDDSRKERELSDIQLLMEHFNTTFDWDIVKEYFNIFEQKKLFEKLKKRYEKI